MEAFPSRPQPKKKEAVSATTDKNRNYHPGHNRQKLFSSRPQMTKTIPYTATAEQKTNPFPAQPSKKKKRSEKTQQNGKQTLNHKRVCKANAIGHSR